MRGAASVVASLPRVLSDSNLSVSSSMSSADASMDWLPHTVASSFACTVGELVGRSQYFLSAIRGGFCPGDQEKFALFGFQQAAEIQAQLQASNEQLAGAVADAGGVQDEEATMADETVAERIGSTSSSQATDQSMTPSSGLADAVVHSVGETTVSDVRAQASVAAGSSSVSTTLQSPPPPSSLSPSGMSPTSATPLPSSVTALHTFWLTLLRSELGVDESQLEQLRRMRDTMAPFTAQLRELESSMATLQPTVLSHQQRMLQVRRRVRGVMSDEQFERLQRWLDKNEWVDHMLTSQIPALALAAQQQQVHGSSRSGQHSQHGAAGSGMPRTASGTRLSSAAANTAGAGGGSDEDDDDDEDEMDSDEGDEDEQRGASGPPARKTLHSRSMSIAEEKEEND